MNSTVASVVLFVTLVLGTITKNCNFCKKISIPIQNLVVGLLAGIVCYYAGLENNMLEAIVLSVISSFSAGGLYDLTKITKNASENKEST